ncbi:hypothetical protein GCM10009599_03540 [Luteococcus peritonei]
MHALKAPEEALPPALAEVVVVEVDEVVEVASGAFAQPAIDRARADSMAGATRDFFTELPPEQMGTIKRSCVSAPES